MIPKAIDMYIHPENYKNIHTGSYNACIDTLTDEVKTKLGATNNSQLYLLSMNIDVGNFFFEATTTDIANILNRVFQAVYDKEQSSYNPISVSLIQLEPTLMWHAIVNFGNIPTDIIESRLTGKIFKDVREDINIIKRVDVLFNNYRSDPDALYPHPWLDCLYIEKIDNLREIVNELKNKYPEHLWIWNIGTENMRDMTYEISVRTRHIYDL